jgi:SAM-dependent methyltransferase
MTTSPAHVSANVERFMGFADVYDAYRPRPPLGVLDILTQLAQAPQPALVDLGSGTGLSTAIWAGRAVEVVGVEPSADMRRQAEARTVGLPDAANVRYQAGYSNATGLPDGCADIVTCSQSLHWMDPEPTFAEAARLMRTGGVFAAYDYDWPPVVDPELDDAYEQYQRRRAGFRRAHGIQRGGDRWPKHEHLERMRASGRFGFCREILLHSVEEGDADRVVGFTRSLGLPVVELSYEEADDELGVYELAAVAMRVLGDRTVPFVFGYRVRVGVR